VPRIVVVGAGLAGARTCTELRSQGYRGELVLLGAEADPPYDRPLLSKAVLVADQPPDLALPLPSDVDLRLATTATGLAGTVVSTDHGELEADAVVIATGSAPRRLPGEGRQHVLRTRGDALGLRAALVPGAQVVVVGAGWIGAEVATAALARGCAVTVVEAGTVPLAHALGTDVGAALLPWWRGVDLRVSHGVAGVLDGAVRLAEGEALPADVVVSAVGVTPLVGWLTGSGLPIDRGVVVDDRLTAAPGVLAVGDVAAWWSPRFGARLHAEHWDDAQRGPTVVAAVLRGDPQAVHDPVPYLWSDQLGHRLQLVGHRTAADTAVWRGEPGDASWGVGWLSPQGVLQAYLAADRPRDALQARALVARSAAVDPARLGDPSVAVRDV